MKTHYEPVYLTRHELSSSLHIGPCDEAGLESPSNHLCHIVDGSVSVVYSIVANNTATAETEGRVSTQVTTTLQDIFEDKDLLSSSHSNGPGTSLIMPITTSPPDYLLSNDMHRKIMSPTTVVSFCAGLFATIALLFFTKKKYLLCNSGIEDRNKRSDGESTTPRRSLRRIGIISPRGGQNYLDLDDNILPDSSGTTITSGFQTNAFNFEPVLAATTSTESESVSLSVEPFTAATMPSLHSPGSSDSSCPFDDLPEDDSKSYGSVDLDCSVVGDGDLSTIFEEPTFSHSVSF